MLKKESLHLGKKELPNGRGNKKGELYSPFIFVNFLMLKT
jgi:hypothetical protein